MCHANGSDNVRKEAIPEKLMLLCHVARTRSCATLLSALIVPQSFLRQTCDSLHSLSHPGIRTITNLVSDHFSCQCMKKDIWTWTHTCTVCYRSKVHRQTEPPMGKWTPLRLVSARFALTLFTTVRPHTDTLNDGFTRWPEAIPLNGINSESMACALLINWMAEFCWTKHVTSN